MDTEIIFDDASLQQKYEKRIFELRKAVKEKYAEYSDVFHLVLIEQIARSEIFIVMYERLVSNDDEGKSTGRLLNQERTHLKALYTDLQITIRGMRGDKTQIDHSFSTDFKEYLTNALGSVLEGDEEEYSGDDDIDEEEDSA